MRLLFALSGFHRMDRGAETALLSVATHLCGMGVDVTVAGSGDDRPDAPYSFVHVPSPRREKFERVPPIPFFRNETQWEDAVFAARFPGRLGWRQFDATVTCAYPYSNWALRRLGQGQRPAHFYVTQNGDWAASTAGAEFRFFSCDGLICTNEEFYSRNQHRWNCALIPNGIDLDQFAPGNGSRDAFGLPARMPVVLMVSAFIDTKRVLDGIRAVAKVEGTMLVVAGDGPLRAEADALAEQVMPGRYRRLSLTADQMPQLYRSADVFLHLSKVESFGNVYLEAAATGLPIVAHDYGLTRWILGDAPFLCDSDDPAHLAASLRGALHAGRSERVADLDRFAWPSVAGQYRDFITRTLAAGGRSDV